MSSQISLYIPTLKVSCDVERIIYIFWKFNLGKIDRVDFVPIMIPVKGKTEPQEDRRFKKAFIYLDVKSSWHPDIITAVEAEKPYKFYPNRDEHFESLRDDSYWLLLKNKSPVPYTTTTLNVHQLAHNNTLLEAKVSDMEAEILKMKLEIERIQVENDNMYRQLTPDVARERCDSHSTTESEAEAFVNSLENIMRMNEEQQSIFHDENGLYQDYIRERMYSGFRCTDIGCNHSNEEDESSKWCDHSNKEEEEEEDIQEGSIKGDISILGWIQSKEEEYKEEEEEEEEEFLVYDDSGEMTPRGRVVKKEDRLEVCRDCGLKKEISSLGWRHADYNLCLDCLKLSCLSDENC